MDIFEYCIHETYVWAQTQEQATQTCLLWQASAKWQIVGGMMIYDVTSTGWLSRWQYTKECRGLGLDLPELRVRFSKAVIKSQSMVLRHFNMLELWKVYKWLNMSSTDEWKDVSAQWSSKGCVIGETSPRVQTDIITFLKKHSLRASLWSSTSNP